MNNRNYEAEYDLVVIGAGPAGMMCAYTAAERGLSVAVFDPNRQAGRKLRITGKGRCNVTNNSDVKSVLNNVTVNSKFLYSALNAFPPEKTISFFENAGVPLKTERGNRVFPVSDNANDVADAIYRKCIGKKVTFYKGIVKEVLYNGESVCGVLSSDGKRYNCGSVAVCTGGKSYPLTGSTGDGYRFAEKAGHTIADIYPSLVPLVSDDAYCEEMQGLSLKNVKLSLYCDGKVIYSDFGEMLFTHFGVSGPLVLSASAYVRNPDTKNYHIEIDLKSALDEETLDQRLLRDFAKYSNREFKNSLNDLLAAKMIPVVIKLSGIDPETKVNSIKREERKKLLKLLKAFPVSVTGTRPVDEAIVTSGGVNTKEINPRTMESKLKTGLYFAGEVIDVDAYTGGYNLQIAWSTGYIAGMAVKPKIEIKGE